MIQQGDFATSFFDASLATNFLKKLLTKKNSNPGGVKILNGVTTLMHQARSQFLMPLLKTTFMKAYEVETHDDLVALAEPREQGKSFPCLCPFFEESNSDDQPTGARLISWLSDVQTNPTYLTLMEV